MNLSDSILIAKIIVYDDHLAFKKLVERYQSDIRGLLFRLTNGNADIVDDLAQECFIRIYKYLSSYNAKAKFKTWLFNIFSYAALRPIDLAAAGSGVSHVIRARMCR